MQIFGRTSMICSGSLRGPENEQWMYVLALRISDGTTDLPRTFCRWMTQGWTVPFYVL